MGVRLRPSVQDASPPRRAAAACGGRAAGGSRSGMGPGPGSFTVSVPTVNKIVNFLASQPATIHAYVAEADGRCVTCGAYGALVHTEGEREV